MTANPSTPPYISTASCPACGAEAARGSDSLAGIALHACPRCRLRFAADVWDMPVDYDALYRGEDYGRDHVKAVRRRAGARWARFPTYLPFFERLGPAGGRSLLEIGCGVGKVASAAVAHGWRVTGFDVSDQAIAVAREHLSCPLYQGTIDDAVARGETYDVVASFEVLEHLREPAAFLSKMRSLLAPGGTAFLTVPNWDCEPVQTTSRADLVPPVHLSFFTRESLLALAARAGFRVREVGEVLDDPFVAHPKSMARWALNRAKGRRVVPLGLWLAVSG